MAKKKEKKKTSPVFLGIVVTFMLAVFAAQMLFPTNLGKIYGERTEGAVEISVTISQGETAGITYYTASAEDMAAFEQWAEDKTMRNRSIADSLTPDANRIVKYNFAIKKADGSFTDLIIDEKGFVHVGAQLYKISGSAEEFLQELEAQLESWEA